MCTNTLHVRCSRVISEKDGTVKGFVDALHHHKRAGPWSNNHNVLRQFFYQEILSVAVRIAHHYIRRPGFDSSFDRCVHFLRHKFPVALVFKTWRSQLFIRHHANDAFHVSRNVDFQLLLRVQRLSEHGEKDPERNDFEFHESPPIQAPCGGLLVRLLHVCPSESRPPYSGEFPAPCCRPSAASAERR